MPPAPPPTAPPPRGPASPLPAFAAARFSAPAGLEVLVPPGRGIALARQALGHAPGAQTEIDVPPSRQHVLLLRSETEGAPEEVWAAGRHQSLRPARGQASLLPAGVDSRWIKRGLADRVLHLHLEPAWLGALGAEEGLAVAGAPPLRLLPGDPVLAGLAGMLEAERAHGPVPFAFAEHWAVMVALRLLRAPEAAPRARCAIAPRRLAAVRDFCEANLARDIGLAEMAAVAGLSRFHFARAFKHDVGLSPAAWLAARRVARARRMLLEGTELELVALACGFATRARMAAAFRRVTGASPARWREARRA